MSTLQSNLNFKNLPILDPAAPNQPLPPRGPYIDNVGSLATRRTPSALQTPHSALTPSPPLHPLTPSPAHSPFPTPHSPLVASRAEMDARGWDAVDIVFVTGDAYVDHPSFAMALLGRLFRRRRLPRRHPQPTRLALRRALAARSDSRASSSPSAPATWTR